MYTLETIKAEMDYRMEQARHDADVAAARAARRRFRRTRKHPTH